MVLTKTVEESDYGLIVDEVMVLKHAYNVLTSRGVKIEIGHDHRFWEYGVALKAFHNWMNTDNPKIADIGAGLSLLGPSISYSENLGLTEVEPNSSYEYDRNLCNGILLDLKKPKIDWVNTELNTFRQWYNTSNFYDVVFCISVIEHVAADHEFLRNLAEMVKSGGLLFLTTDVMPRMPKENGAGYHFDNLREHNYTMYDVCKMIEYLNVEKGFELLGESDLEYKGDKVFDYSFCSIAMRKK